jgi:hypothetical protein
MLLALACALTACRERRPAKPAPAPAAPAVQTPPPETPTEERDRRWREAAAADTAQGWLELGNWLEARGLEGRAALAWQKGIAREPDHEALRTKLGYRRYDGQVARWREKKWLTASEWEEARKEAPPPASEAGAPAGPAFLLVDSEASDARRQGAESLLEEVRARPGLKRFTFTASLQGPYLLLVQKTNTAEKDQWFHRSRGHVLLTLYRTWRKEFAEPFELGKIEARNGERSYLPSVTFLSREDFDAFNQAIANPVGQGVAAYYRPDQRIIICYEEPGAGSFVGRKNFNLNKFFHEGVHQLVDAYTKGGSACFSHWWQEGFADFLGAAEKTSDDRTGQDTFTLMVNNPFRVQSLRHGTIDWFFKLEELLRLKDKLELMNAARKKAGKDQDDRDAVGSIFYAQAWSLVHFFWYGDGGKYRPALLRYIGEELKGRSGFEVFRETFGNPDLEALDEAWQEHCRGLEVR